MNWLDGENLRQARALGCGKPRGAIEVERLFPALGV